MITKNSTNFFDNDFFLGEVILIDKSPGFTSFDIIKKLKKILNMKKIGHSGTLDPAATGLMIICTGKKTKEIYKYQGLNKKYIGTITLGKTTPSMDGETEAVEEKEFDFVTKEMIYKVRDSFLGKTLQKPPMYSALKYKGKALYKYARKGIEVERKSREIFISEFKLSSIELPDINFEITSSKGTYMRVIANDFGNKLRTGGYLSKLRRIAIGQYNIENALTLDEFENIYLNRFSLN